jgi:tetratricopeptide (TPR) repeat protein
MKSKSKKSKIRIVSRLSPEFTSTFTVNDATYEVYTEDKGEKVKEVASTIYLKGRIVHSKKYNYSHLSKLKDFNDKLISYMEKQHKSTIQEFLSEKTKTRRLKSEYFEEVQELLKSSKGKEALEHLKKALEDFPLDPFFLSYYGCLVAIVERDTKEGIKICKQAIKKLDAAVPFGSEFYHSIFYLNLGRALLSDRKKADAIKSFKKGLRNDPENTELISALHNLGVRRKPPVKFLKRSNPINKYVGKLLSKPSLKG